MGDYSKRGELSKSAIYMLIFSLVLVLAIITWIILRNNDFSKDETVSINQEILDLKISQVKKINEDTLDVTLKRGVGEGEFVGLSFTVNDGSRTETVRINSSMPENQSGTFSLNFISINASKIKSISVTPIFQTKSGQEIIGETEDEYITPNTCSNYCPVGAQCGVNGCGMQCGSGCNSGYLCLNYKCIRQQTSSGGSSGGGSGSGSSNDDINNDDENETVCTPTTCLALQRTCGAASDGCQGTLNCGICGTGYSCNSTGQCVANACLGSFNQSCLIENGVGIQTRTCINPPTWDTWGECTVVSCNLNYVESGNTCIASTCLGSSTQTCSIVNGVGSQSRECINGVWGDWGTCTAISCNSEYTLCGNSCDVSSRSCDINNGVGSQSRTCVNNAWSSWGICNVVSCNSCYTPSGNSCVVIDCNDNNACTIDSCSNNLCVHNAITGCCTSSSQCNDNNACTTDSCSNNLCVHNVISGCCTSSSQCNDNNACTTDVCSSGLCSNLPISNCCTSSSQCNDNNACTTDVCSLGLCSNLPISNCCTSSSQCNDNNACTTDVCSLGLCSNVPITPCCGNLIIDGTEQCDGTNLNQQTCATRLGTSYIGTLSCTSSCIFNTNLCVSSCTSETNTAFCSRLNKNCGSVTALDNCGISRTVSCGTCISPQTCNATNMCSCTVTSYTPALNTFCGSRSVTTNCGTTVTMTGTLSCTSPQTCINNACSCTVTSYTPALNTFCGSRSVTTNCGTTVTMTGTLSCTSPQTCINNACSCTVTSYTPALNTFCGSRSVTTNCGTTVTMTGTLSCTSPQTCINNACSCTPETNTAFCSRLNKNCGSVTALDNCGVSRTVSSCGTCSTGYYCSTNNVCVACTTHSYSSCYNGDVYWYNSCGQVEGIRYDCNSTQTCSSGACVNNPILGNTIIIDHTTTNVSKIPLSCINKIKTDLDVAYSHTSHGSQLYTGMLALEAQNSLYSLDFNVVSGQLHFEDYYGYGDQSGFATGGCYDLSACDNGADGLLGPTREFLDSSNGADINVIMWSWCSIAGHNIPFYLSTMQTAITEYPNVKFVFITGHAEGGGEGDSSDSRNNVIRDFVNNNAFCDTHQCILFDFADIENYDPDNNYFLDKYVTDSLNYNAGNWGEEYLGRHPTGLNADLTGRLYSTYGCSHSSSPYGANINCALKGQAVWYMFARMVGWDGNPSHGC